MLNPQTLAQWARELGFAETGFCLPDPFIHAQRVAAQQEPIAERRQLRFSPAQEHPEAKSIAVLLWPYAPAQPASEGEVFVDSYYQASNAAYHAARRLEERLLESGCYAKANVSYPAKEAAIRAGMGIIGLNSLLITPRYGSRVVIILMATGIDIQLTTHDPDVRSCPGCRKCIAACPAGALDEKGMSHPEKCLRNFMMEGVVVPEALRKKIGMRLIGCDICQRVCPLQPTAEQAREKPYLLCEFVTDDAPAFSSAVSKLANEIGRNTARPQRVRAQAALLAGNTRNTVYLPVLRQWARMPFDTVREHAQWAIAQIESAGAHT